MYALRNNKIFEIEEMVKPSRRGTAYWCKLKDYTRLKIISARNIFESKEEAENYL